MRQMCLATLCGILPLISSAAWAAEASRGSGNAFGRLSDSAITLGNQDEPLKSVEGGRAQPLATLTQRLDGKLGGRVIDAKLTNQNGREVYDLTVLSDQNVVHHVIIDAETGAPL